MAAKILLSPTEHKLASKFGNEAITSSIPEQKGADILAITNKGLFGMQRKEVPNDFILSISDGRMGREILLLAKSCKIARVIGEGKFKYWPDGRIVTGQINRSTRKPVPSRFNKRHIEGLLFDIESVAGVPVDWTDSLDDTVSYIRHMIDLINNDKHLGLYTRPSAQGTWYVPKAKDIQLWILQSFPGIGPATADKIIEKFGGEIPIKWTCTFEELASINGISKERAKTMMEAFGGFVPEDIGKSISKAIEEDNDRDRISNELARLRANIGNR